MSAERFLPFRRLICSRPIRSAAWHPSGETYAVGTNSKKIIICSYPSPEELLDFKQRNEKQDSDNNSQNPLSTASGHIVESKTNVDSPIILYKFLQVHQGSVYCIDFDPSGKLLASGSNDHVVHIISYNAEKKLPEGSEYKLTMHNGTVRAVMFMNNQQGEFSNNQSNLLASAGAGDNEIFVSDCNSMKPIICFTGHDKQVMSLAQYNGPTNLISASIDGSIRFWDTREKNCIFKVLAGKLNSEQTGKKNTTSLSGHEATSISSSEKSSQPSVVRTDPSGKLLICGFGDGRCMLYDIRGRKVMQNFQAHDGEMRSMTISPKSYYLLTGGFDGKLVLYDLQGDLTRRLPNVCLSKMNDKIVNVAWHPQRPSFLTTSAQKNSATLWTMDQGQGMLDFSALNNDSFTLN